MLYIVLVLVLAALGLLVTALITASSLWAWVSIGLSVLAGVMLVADWLRRRRRAAAPTVERAEPVEPAEPSEPAADTKPGLFTEPEKPAENPAEEEQTVLIPAAGELGDPADTPEPDVVEEPAEKPAEEPSGASAASAASAGSAAKEEPAPADDAEPGEESTSAADIALLADLDDEVFVVDEHPRYHLRVCAWVGIRDTIPIGIGEARQLGFTPCARCGPDETLVAAHR
ncbi:hypothetical protein OHS18_16230 [Amycolatopsis sp. NBC_00355]|uniref:hypothetical protein n=1 Tax=Amycolatopsis sp. NBC_00355 TaxID=2975957 RepID=UPI002E264C53